MKKIFIREWEDLDLQTGDFNLRVHTNGSMCIYNSNIFVSQLYIKGCSREVTLAWLKSFGFDVEFTILKSCPFCGSTARITDGGFDGKHFFIGCQAGDCIGYTGITKNTRIEAIEVWNRRAENV